MKYFFFHREKTLLKYFQMFLNVFKCFQITFYSPGCFLQKTLETKLPVKLYEMAQQQLKYKERTDETLLKKTFTQTFGLARFPNDEAMKLTKGDVSQCPVFNFKKNLKRAIIEKYQ
jgi:hypothetical protein